MPNQLSSLEDIYRFSESEDVLPPVAVTARRTRFLELFGLQADEGSVMSLESAEVRSRLWGELVQLVASLRDETIPPSSVLLSLIREDGQTIGSIAASVDRDVEEVEDAVLAMQAEGWVSLQREDGVERVRLLLFDSSARR